MATNTIIKDYFKNKQINAQINVVNTGVETLTGSRLKRLSKNVKRNIYVNLWRWFIKY